MSIRLSIALVGAPALSLACMSLPAHAQAPLSMFERAANDAVHSCFWYRGSIFDGPDKVGAACDPAMARLKALLAMNPEGDDLNIYYGYAAIIDMRVAGAYRQAAKEAGACERYERSWLSISKVDPAASPARTEQVQESVTGIAEFVRDCRKTYPAPAGAPPLPPEKP